MMGYEPLDYPTADALERDLLDLWERESLFRQTLEQGRAGEPFVFHEGPPTANGHPGIHHVFARTIKDLVCRYQAMCGRQVTRIAGWDTHGLPVEIAVEKALNLSGKADIERFGVAEFNRRCRESAFTYKSEFEALSTRIGYWLEYDRAYVTYTKAYIESVWWLLAQLHERVLLVEGHKVLPYCPRCGTALSSHELALGYATHRSPSIHVRFRLVEPAGEGARGTCSSGPRRRGRCRRTSRSPSIPTSSTSRWTSTARGSSSSAALRSRRRSPGRRTASGSGSSPCWTPSRGGAWSGDHIVDFGPGAGKFGGEIVAEGTFDEIKDNPRSITGRYLSGKNNINIRSLNMLNSDNKNGLAYRENGGDYLKISGCSQYNLKNIDVRFPLKKFICITGVSGSGKSTLLVDTLYKAIENILNKKYKEEVGKYSDIQGFDKINKAVLLDQSAIGRTPRSNPATYTKVFDAIRDVFSQTKPAKINGYKKGRFSFNVKGGRCETCEGQGQIKIEMQFMSDIWITCDVCQGKRYNNQTLDVEFRGKNIADVLKMTIEESIEYFHSIPTILYKLDTFY